MTNETASTAPANWPDRIRDILAAIAGATAFVYITGGIIVGLRMFIAELPTVSVVGQLPRDVLFSVGLGQGVLPALAFGAVFAASRSELYSASRKNWSSQPRLPGLLPRRERLSTTWAQKRGASLWWHIAWTVAAALIIIAPAVASVLFGSDDRNNNAARQWAAIGGLFVVTWLAALLYLNMRAQIVRAYPISAAEAGDGSGESGSASRPPASTDETYPAAPAAAENHFTSVPATVLHALLFTAMLVPGCVAFWSTRPLEQATVYTTRTATEVPQEISGLLVGQTKEVALVGAMDGGTITTIPTAQIRRVVLGP